MTTGVDVFALRAWLDEARSKACVHSAAELDDFCGLSKCTTEQLRAASCKATILRLLPIAWATGLSLDALDPRILRGARELERLGLLWEQCGITISELSAAINCDRTTLRQCLNEISTGICPAISINALIALADYMQRRRQDPGFRIRKREPDEPKPKRAKVLCTPTGGEKLAETLYMRVMSPLYCDCYPLRALGDELFESIGELFRTRIDVSEMPARYRVYFRESGKLLMDRRISL